MRASDDSDSAFTLEGIRRDWDAGRPVLVPTSGTTGTPRVVEHSAAAVEASARAVSHALAVDPDRDRWLACVPLRRVAGRAIVLRALITETPVVVHEHFDVDAVSEAAGECTLVSLVATQLRRLLDARAPLERFRSVLVGGGAVPAELIDRALDAGVAVHTTYGLTETFGGCVHDGAPLAGVEIDLDPYTDEIRVGGPVLMSRYVDDPLATRAAFTDDGRLRTGDIGVIDESGRLRVVDRIKDADHLLDFVFRWCAPIGYVFLVDDRTAALLFVFAFIYSAMNVNAFLAFGATGALKITYLGLGPTEIRLVYIAVNAMVGFLGHRRRKLFIRGGPRQRHGGAS